MKGWVYVITNRAMPGLVKVGYSTKDPELRAEELNHTGSPHPYLVEYELLIDEPYQIEQKTHKLLFPKREAKEWFRCTPEEAVVAIKQIAGNRTIIETYKRAERAKAEALHQQELQEREAQLKQQQAEQEIEDRLLSEESAIRQKYQQQFAAKFPPRPFWNYWLGGSILALIGIFMMLPKVSGDGAFILAAIGGAILGVFLRDYFEKERKHSTGYLSLEKQRESELETVRARVVSCQGCGKQQQKTILLVDDEESIHLLYREELEEEGYVVYSAMSAEEGLTLLQSSLPDLIISNINMPGMNGIDFCGVCKEKYPNVPFLFCSSYKEFKQDPVTCSSDGYIVKSSSLDELKALVKKLLFPITRY